MAIEREDAPGDGAAKRRKEADHSPVRRRARQRGEVARVRQDPAQPVDGLGIEGAQLRVAKGAPDPLDNGSRHA